MITTVDETRSPVAGGAILKNAILEQVSTGPDGGAHWRSTLVILILLAAGYALTILVFQPGYITLDARYLYNDGKVWNFGDWQSPVMGVLWWLIDPLAPGAWSMFLFIATLYWLGFGLLALTVARRTPWLGMVTPLLALAPPAFFLVGMIWRDVLFGVVWLVAAVLPFAVAGSQRSCAPADADSFHCC